MYRYPTRSRPSRPPWLVSFADLVALLLAFFVMLFATQRVERLPWEALISSLSRSLNPALIERPAEPSEERNVRRLSARRAVDLNYLEKLLHGKVAAERALREILIRRDDAQLTIELPTDSLFPAGSARLTDGARRVIFSLAGILRDIGNRIDVHGHTDPSPVRGTRHGSNWQLSIARATAVADELHRVGYHREISALGYADTKFFDVAGLDARPRAFSAARRVEVIIRPTRQAAP
jgi:chemotaxis protein MotB